MIKCTLIGEVCVQLLYVHFRQHVQFCGVMFWYTFGGFNLFEHEVGKKSIQEHNGKLICSTT